MYNKISEELFDVRSSPGRLGEPNIACVAAHHNSYHWVILSTWPMNISSSYDICELIPKRCTDCMLRLNDQLFERRDLTGESPLTSFDERVDIPIFIELCDELLQAT
jgi:hypothetical protein